MTHINKLLQKYYKPNGENKTANIRVNPAERFSNEYHNNIRLEQRNKHRHILLDTILNESPFHLTKTQTQQIRYWIDTIPDFKNLHRQASEETIILALIFIQQKQTNARTQVYKYTISDKYDLTVPIFETIQNRLIFHLMQTTPLTYNQQIYLNHEIEKNKPR